MAGLGGSWTRRGIALSHFDVVWCVMGRCFFASTGLMTRIHFLCVSSIQRDAVFDGFSCNFFKDNVECVRTQSRSNYRTTKTKPSLVLPGGDVVDLAHTGLRCAIPLSLDHAGRLAAGLLGDVGQHVPQEALDVAVHLLKLQQEGIVPLGRVNGRQPRVGNAFGQLLLLGVRKQAVALDPDDEGGLLEQLQRAADVAGPAPRDVVRVQLARGGNVAVCVKALDELVALVAQVRLSGEVGGGLPATVSLAVG